MGRVILQSHTGENMMLTDTVHATQETYGPRDVPMFGQTPTETQS